MNDQERFFHASRWIDGFDVEDKNGHKRHHFPPKGSKEERLGRHALAHLLLSDRLPRQLRHRLAMLIDPTVFATDDHPPIAPYMGKPKKHHSRFDIARSRIPDITRASQIAWYVAERVTAKRGSVKKAIESASKEFGLSERTIMDDIWAPRADLLRFWPAGLVKNSDDHSEEALPNGSCNTREMEP